MPLGSNIKLEDLNKLIDGFSGADIETWCREAAMLALRENIRARKVSIEHFKESRKFVNPTLTTETLTWYEKFGEKLKSRSIEESKEDRLFV